MFSAALLPFQASVSNVQIPTFISVSHVGSLLFRMSTSCENYGVTNSSSCACPPGFGGPTCSQPACGGNIFQGSGRAVVPLPSDSNASANLTSASCSCESGWIGTACNVCQTASACQAGLTAAGGQGSSTSAPDLPTGQNETITCNTVPRVYAAGAMSCQV